MKKGIKIKIEGSQENDCIALGILLKQQLSKLGVTVDMELHANNEHVAEHIMTGTKALKENSKIWIETGANELTLMRRVFRSPLTQPSLMDTVVMSQEEVDRAIDGFEKSNSLKL